MKPLAYWKSFTWLGKLLVAFPILLALDVALVGDFYHRSTIDDTLQTLASVFAAVLLTLAWEKLRQEDNPSAKGWGFIAVATWLYAIGSVIFLFVEDIERHPAFPGFADVPRLLFYPVMIAGLLLLPRPRMTRNEIANTLLDLIAFALVAAMIVWEINLRYVMEALHTRPTNALRVSEAYAIADSVLLMIVFFVLIRTLRVGWQLVPILLLLIGSFFVILSDLVQGSFSTTGETFYSGAAIDLGWMIFYCLLGLAGNFILTRHTRPPLNEHEEILQRRRGASWMIAITDGWIGAVIVVLIWSLFRRGYIHPAWVTMGLIGGITLALSRQVRTMHEVTQLYLQLLATNASLEEKVRDRTKQLRESEDALRREKVVTDAIFENAPGLLLLYDDHYHLARTNAWGRKVLRLNGRDLSTWDQGEGAVEEDRPRARAAVTKVLQEGGPEVVEVRAINPEGPPIPHFFTVVRVMIDGKPYALSIGQDISAVKKAEEALRCEKAVTDTLFAEMPGLLLLYDDQYHLVRTNKWGHKILELDGRDLSTWEQGERAVEEDRPRAREAVNRTLQNGGPETVDVRVITPDGPVPYFFTDVRVMIDGKPHVLAIGQDISAAKKAEEAMRREKVITDTVFAGIPGFLFLYDEQGHLLRTNAWGHKILGLDGRDLSTWVQGESLVEEDRARALESVRRVLKQGGPEAVECRVRTTHGPVPYLFTNVRVMMDGKPHLIAIGVDISDRKKAEEALRREKAVTDSVFAGMPGILNLYSDQGQLVRANSWGWEVMGLDGKDLSSWRLGDGVIDEDRETTQETARKVLEDGGPHAVECRVRTIHGPIPYYFTGIRLMIEGKPHLIAIGFDISDRKMAEEAMQREKDITDAIFDVMPGFLFVHDENGKLVRWNRNGREQLGVTDERLGNWKLGDGVADEDREGVRAAAAMVLSEGTPQVVQGHIKTIHGLVPYYMTGVRLIIDGKPHMLGVGIDISERVKAEQALKRERSLTDAMFESMPGVVYLYDGQGRLLRWNATMKETLGATDEELRDSHLGDFLREEDLVCAHEAVTRVMKEGRAIIECDLRTVNGYVPYLFTGTRLVIDGKPYLLGEGIDISERKRAEDTLRREKAFIDAVVEHMPAVLSLYDDNRHLIRWNKRIKDLTGFADEELAKRFAGDAQPPEEREHINQAAETILKEGSVVIESWLKTKAGGRIPFLYTGIRLVLDGKPHILTIGVDISERKRYEEQLRAALDRAEAASRAKDRFLAAASHELRTPLAPVMLMTTALEADDTLPAEVRRDISIIRENIEIEKRLVANLLDFTEVYAGKLQLRLVLTDVHEVLHSAMRQCQEEISRKGQRWEIHFGARRYRTLADPDRLRQVFLHLLQNASKFSPANSAILVSTSQDGTGAGDRIRIEITDSGRGIPQEILPRLFQPFEQGPRDIQGMQHYGGLGLGLAISRAIIDAHGGIIGATSQGIDRGSTFFVDLPIKIEAAPVPPPAARKPVTPPVRPLKLLIVEDHPSTLQTLARLLKVEGHDVTTATTMAEARAAIDGRDFDLVLTDIGLPDGSGWELGPFLQAHHAMPGIALSGYGAADDVENSRKAGFLAHLTKPVTVHTLREALAKIPPRTVGAA